MVRDHFLFHRERDRISSSDKIDKMNGDFFTDEDWDNFLPTKAVEYEDMMNPRSTPPATPPVTLNSDHIPNLNTPPKDFNHLVSGGSSESSDAQEKESPMEDQDWESLISAAVENVGDSSTSSTARRPPSPPPSLKMDETSKDSVMSGEDLLRTALQEFDADFFDDATTFQEKSLPPTPPAAPLLPNTDPLPAPAFSFTFDPKNLSLKPQRCPSLVISNPEVKPAEIPRPTPAPKMSKSEALRATLERNRLACAMKNAHKQLTNNNMGNAQKHMTNNLGNAQKHSTNNLGNAQRQLNMGNRYVVNTHKPVLNKATKVVSNTNSKSSLIRVNTSDGSGKTVLVQMPSPDCSLRMNNKMIVKAPKANNQRSLLNKNVLIQQSSKVVVAAQQQPQQRIIINPPQPQKIILKTLPNNHHQTTTQHHHHHLSRPVIISSAAKNLVQPKNIVHSISLGGNKATTLNIPASTKYVKILDPKSKTFKLIRLNHVTNK